MDSTTVFRTDKLKTTDIISKANNGILILLDCYTLNDYYVDLIIDLSQPHSDNSLAFTTFSKYMKHGCHTLIELPSDYLPDNELHFFINRTDIDSLLDVPQTLKGNYYLKIQSGGQRVIHGFGYASEYQISKFIVRKPEPKSVVTDSFGKSKIYF